MDAFACEFFDGSSVARRKFCRCKELGQSVFHEVLRNWRRLAATERQTSEGRADCKRSFAKVLDPLLFLFAQILFVRRFQFQSFSYQRVCFCLAGVVVDHEGRGEAKIRFEIKFLFGRRKSHKLQPKPNGTRTTKIGKLSS